ncbi:MAG TPA: AI-2E family transporter [Myxococcaceae bacterium]|nr:AI-2E family transporter [Myxococcaceae bacterium]
MAEAHSPSPRSRSTLRIEISPSSIFLGVLVVATVWLLGRLVPVLVTVASALMVAGTLAPMVRWLEERRIRRGLALAIVFVGATALFAVILLITVPSIWRAAVKFAGDLPRLRDDLVRSLAAHPRTSGLAQSVRRLAPERLLEGVDLGAALAVGASLAEVITYGIAAIFLTIYLLADRERLRGVLYALVPRRFHVRTGRVLISLEAIVGGYIRGQIITSALIALFTFILLTVLRVPDALALAAFAGFTDVIPFVGGILATAPAALAGLERGTGVMIAILVLMVAYQEFESRLLIPRIYGRTLKLPSAGVLVALLVGGRLGGVFGALFALPIAAAIVSIVKELRVELPGDPGVDPAQREEDARAERAYARRAEGASPTEAAQTALDVAEHTPSRTGKP